MTLYKSPQFKNLFDQLEFTTNEWRMAIETLVSIASGVGVECHIVEAQPNRALLEDTKEITFNYEDMGVG